MINNTYLLPLRVLLANTNYLMIDSSWLGPCPDCKVSFNAHWREVVDGKYELRLNNDVRRKLLQIVDEITSGKSKGYYDIDEFGKLIPFVLKPFTTNFWFTGGMGNLVYST